MGSTQGLGMQGDSTLDMERRGGDSHHMVYHESVHDPALRVLFGMGGGHSPSLAARNK